MLWLRVNLVLLLVTVTTPAFAQTNLIAFRSGETQTALLELYTSEGCSSCPPAEAWLSRLKQSPRLWKDFVPVALHVDYWDNLGWRDPWGSAAFSDRQRSLAAGWHSDTIYTPEFVLNGREWRDWRGQNDVPSPANLKIGTLAASSSDAVHWRIAFTPLKNNNVAYEVHAAWLGNDLNSNVKAGENSGRQLKHDFVILNLVQVPLTASGDMRQAELILNPPKQSSGSSSALAVWVTEAGKLEPLQATGGSLESSHGK